jgi:mannosyltransferase OCH1-like enzyme
MIPKILHYVWIGPYKDSQTYVDDWLSIQPDYQLMRWENDTAMKYIHEVIDTYGLDSLKDKSMTYISDIVRLMVVRDYGGIYLDHDIMLVKDFTELLTKDLVLTFQYKAENASHNDSYGQGDTLRHIIENKRYGTISKFHSESVNNCFIAATPNHPFVLRALELTLENHNKKPEEQLAMSDWGVGPGVFTRIINEYELDTSKAIRVENDNVIVYECELLHPTHGYDRLELGKDAYKKHIQAIVDAKSSYAVHYHEHFGTGSFIERKLILFGEWFKSL